MQEFPVEAQLKKAQSAMTSVAVFITAFWVAVLIILCGALMGIVPWPPIHLP